MKRYYYLLYRFERIFRVGFEELGWFRRGYERTGSVAAGPPLLLLPSLLVAPYYVPGYRHWQAGQPGAALLATLGLVAAVCLPLASARYRACAREFAEHSALRNGLGLLGFVLLAAGCWRGPLHLLPSGPLR